jgi:nucleoside-diphosphate-sugar epimerase
LLLRLLADPEVTRVRSVARRELPAHPKLVHSRADLRDPAARAALDGVDVLWHLGFSLWRGGDGRGANLAGTANVLAARPSRVVLASSAAVYGAWPDNRLPLAEDAPPRPNRQCAYAADKLECERRCLSGAAPALVLRIGAVLGPHADPRIRRAVSGYRRAVPAVRGASEALQFLDEDDVAGALLLAGKRNPVGVVNVAPVDWLTAADVAGVARGRVIRVSLPLLLAASELAFRLRLLPFGADRAVLLGGPLALDAGLAHRCLGWKARLTSSEVLRRALARPPDPP